MSLQVLRLVNIGLRTTHEIAEALSLSSDDAGARIGNLWRAKYLSRQANPHVSRTFIFVLTAKGKEQLQLAGAGDVDAKLRAGKILLRRELRGFIERAAFERRPLKAREPVRREGALDFLQCPTRINDTLYYRDGRQECVA
ncbi:MAG: hypothetical protein KGI52_08825 [Burkholderiales bacterium]|nr:hypothetical protein [Burkholderiales bacterium]